MVAKKQTDSTGKRKAAQVRQLGDLQSIGPAMLKDFEILGISSVTQLAQHEALDLYEELQNRTGTEHDICVLDTFSSAIAQARNPRLPREQCDWAWWSRERKRKVAETEKKMRQQAREGTLEFASGAGARVRGTPIEKAYNIGPTTGAGLREAGIETIEQLRKLGWQQVWRMMVSRNRFALHAVLGYALYGAEHDVMWDKIPAKAKKQALELSAKWRGKKPSRRMRKK